MTETRTFDYVVAGGGTAGCVLAARLSEGGNSVCLIEAGPRARSPALRVPALVGMVLSNPAYGWGYRSVPQAHADGRRIPLPRGRLLGGSGTVNGMVYFRGHPEDFDGWAARGCTGWSFADLLPYFLRSERHQHRASPWHGTAGPHGVSKPQEPNALVHGFLEAARELGLPLAEDFNGSDTEGFGLRDASIYEGRRVSTASAYLEPAIAGGARIEVITGATVDRLLIEGRRVHGVDLGPAGEVSARHEVILTAGAYGSPAVLQRSGVGDPALLSRLGREVVLARPEVGENLRDHPSAEMHVSTRSAVPYGLTWRSVPRNIGYALRYAAARKGPLAGNIFEGVGFTRSRPEATRPDLQLCFMPAARSPHPVPLTHGMGCIAVALRPQSAGQVTIRSLDPRDAPDIDPNILADEADVAVIAAGLRLSRRLFGASPFARHGPQETRPGADIDSDEELHAFIRATAGVVHHPGGTCRMGGDDGSVVDSALRVRGLDGLRVADASIYPTLVAGNSNASVMMIAEKAADMILGRDAPAPMPELAARTLASAG